MEKSSNKNPGNGSKGAHTFFTTVLILGVLYVMITLCCRTGSSEKKAAEPSTVNSTYSSSYRYSSGSGINYGSGSGYRSYSSGTAKKKTSTSQNNKTSKSQNKKAAKKNTTQKRSAKQQAYDDFMDDALEDYLSCVESEDEYWDAVENFSEDWLTPDEKEELDRLLESYSD